EAAGGQAADALDLACAIELIHAASLALDDLPAMDDEQVRRNAPALHRQHGEAAAILASVALIARAFEIAGIHDRARGTDAVGRIARTIGASGMCGGQIVDLSARRAGGLAATPAALEDLYAAKTGCLMALACEIGAIAAGADPARCQALGAFGLGLGIAYQIADDVADRAVDAALGRANYARIAGDGPARRRASALLDDARRQLAAAGVDAAGLAAYARGLIDAEPLPAVRR
ncbi:MAG: polyprenyl synthetase family protein, partial [Alphaproteobacteria bacterium]